MSSVDAVCEVHRFCISLHALINPLVPALALSAAVLLVCWLMIWLGGVLIQVAIKTMLKKYLFSDAEKASVEREIEIQQVRCAL